MEEFEYPMWFKQKNDPLVVEFTGLKEGFVISGNSFYKVGKWLDKLQKHTCDTVWENVTDQYKNKTNIPSLEMCGTPFSIEEKDEIELQSNTKKTYGDFKKEILSDLKNSLNNGGKTDYYQLEKAPFKINDFDDFAEWRNMNGNQFNMGKVMWTFNVGRHSGTDYERDLNKIIHYAQRELLRIKRNNNV